MKKSLRVLLGSCALMGFSVASHATIVTDWTATISGTWTSYSSGVVSSNNGTVLSWGTPAGNDGKSSLTITNPPKKETVTTYIGSGIPPASYTAASNTLTHHNAPITGTSLTSATLTDKITLTPKDPAGSALPAFTFDFNIAFLETPNVAGHCPAASPPNNPCNDIFVLLGGLPSFNFVYDDQSYLVNLFSTSGGTLSTLSDTACAAVNAVNSLAPASGCLGFTTQENKTTKLAFGFTISTVPVSNNVPEPGSIALFGVALLGLAVTRRRYRMR